MVLMDVMVDTLVMLLTMLKTMVLLQKKTTLISINSRAVNHLKVFLRIKVEQQWLKMILIN